MVHQVKKTKKLMRLTENDLKKLEGYDKIKNADKVSAWQKGRDIGVVAEWKGDDRTHAYVFEGSKCELKEVGNFRGKKKNQSARRFVKDKFLLGK